MAKLKTLNLSFIIYRNRQLKQSEKNETAGNIQVLHEHPVAQNNSAPEYADIGMFYMIQTF